MTLAAIRFNFVLGTLVLLCAAASPAAAFLVGEKAGGSGAAKFKIALMMYAKGKSHAEVWRTTGWNCANRSRGTCRRELPASCYAMGHFHLISLRHSNFTGDRYLYQVLGAACLFNAYPSLRKRIRVYDGECKGYWGFAKHNGSVCVNLQKIGAYAESDQVRAAKGALAETQCRREFAEKERQRAEIKRRERKREDKLEKARAEKRRSAAQRKNEREKKRRERALRKANKYFSEGEYDKAQKLRQKQSKRADQLLRERQKERAKEQKRATQRRLKLEQRRKREEKRANQARRQMEKRCAKKRTAAEKKQEANREGMRAAYQTLLHEIQHQIQYIEGWPKSRHDCDYEKRAIEAEAREVQLRSSWTRQQRQSTPPTALSGGGLCF
jgi:hypothetical protein